MFVLIRTHIAFGWREMGEGLLYHTMYAAELVLCIALPLFTCLTCVRSCISGIL